VYDLRLRELWWSKTESLKDGSDRLVFGPHTVVSVANEKLPRLEA